MQKNTKFRKGVAIAAIPLLAALVATPAFAAPGGEPEAPAPVATVEAPAVTPEKTAEANAPTAESPDAESTVESPDAEGTVEATAEGTVEGLEGAGDETATIEGTPDTASSPEKTAEPTVEKTAETPTGTFNNASDAVLNPSLTLTTVLGEGSDAAVSTSNPVTVPKGTNKLVLYVPELSSLDYVYAKAFPQLFVNGAWRSTNELEPTGAIEETITLTSPLIKNGVAVRVVLQVTDKDTKPTSNEEWNYMATPALLVHIEGEEVPTEKPSAQPERGLVDAKGNTVSVGEAHKPAPENTAEAPLTLADAQKWDNCEDMNKAGYGNLPSTSPIAKLLNEQGKPRFGEGEVLCKAEGVKVPMLSEAPAVTGTPDATVIGKSESGPNGGGVGGSGMASGKGLANTGVALTTGFAVAGLLAAGGSGMVALRRKKD